MYQENYYQLILSDSGYQLKEIFISDVMDMFSNLTLVIIVTDSNLKAHIFLNTTDYLGGPFYEIRSNLSGCKSMRVKDIITYRKWYLHPTIDYTLFAMVFLQHFNRTAWFYYDA